MAFAPTFEDLLSYGATEAVPHTRPSSPQPNPLKNRVHKIWSYQNFSRPILYPNLPSWARDPIPAHAIPGNNPHNYEIPLEPLPRSSYDLLLPSFRLASRLLDKSLYFFHTVLNAPVIDAVFPGASRTEERNRFDKMPRSAFVSEHRTEARAQLDLLADHMYFVTAWQSSLYDDGYDGKIAATCSVPDSLTQPHHAGPRPTQSPISQPFLVPRNPGLPPEHESRPIPQRTRYDRAAKQDSPYATTTAPGTSRPDRPAISQPSIFRYPGIPQRRRQDVLTCLPGEVFRLLTHLELWNALPLAKQQRIHFQLAITMVHELVHACYYQRRMHDHEVYWDAEGDTQNELGFAWERWMFGNIMAGIDGEVSGQHNWTRCATDCPCGEGPFWDDLEGPEPYPPWSWSDEDEESEHEENEDEENEDEENGDEENEDEENGGKENEDEENEDEENGDDNDNDVEMRDINSSDSGSYSSSSASLDTAMHEILFPSHAILWEKWHHTSSPAGMRLGSEPACNFVPSHAIEQFFDGNLMNAWTDSARRPANLQIKLLPYITRRTQMWPRSPSTDNRPSETARESNDDFIAYILRIQAASKNHRGRANPWNLRLLEQYKDSGDEESSDDGSGEEGDGDDSQFSHSGESWPEGESYRAVRTMLPACANKYQKERDRITSRRRLPGCARVHKKGKVNRGQRMKARRTASKALSHHH